MSDETSVDGRIGLDHHSGLVTLRQPVAAGGPLLRRKRGRPAATDIGLEVTTIVIKAGRILPDRVTGGPLAPVQGEHSATAAG